ncbi:MAG TPA: helix-turn-helix domain-containing protein [Dehalococcoidia bacterium]|nr:MAG: hypothetical protein A2Z28_01545 [Chloroflexi bacterium RBG_16_51_9]
MSDHDANMTLERYAQEYESDPEFIAEGLSIKVIEEMLDRLEQKEKSQSWLAQQMGVSRAHVSRILNAPPNMTLLTIAKIAVALGVRPDVCLNAQSRLPTPSSVGSTDASFISGHRGAADASGIVGASAFVGTAIQNTREHQRALFQTENYNPFKILDKVDDSLPVA